MKDAFAGYEAAQTKVNVVIPPAVEEVPWYQEWIFDPLYNVFGDFGILVFWIVVLVIGYMFRKNISNWLTALRKKVLGQ